MPGQQGRAERQSALSSWWDDFTAPNTAWLNWQDDTPWGPDLPHPWNAPYPGSNQPFLGQESGEEQYIERPGGGWQRLPPGPDPWSLPPPSPTPSPTPGGKSVSGPSPFMPPDPVAAPASAPFSPPVAAPILPSGGRDRTLGGMSRRRRM